MVNLTIDGKSISVAKGTTILEAARQLGIHIPTLCWLEKVSTTGACRICVVDIEGVDRPMTACNTPVKDGIVVTTQNEKLTRLRKQTMELILVNHPLDCPVCDAGGECDLQDTCYALDVVRQEFKADDVNPDTIDHWPLIQQVPSRCILCEKCVKVCHELIGADALFVNDKGDKAFIDKKVENCTYCGNCVSVCPTGTMISKPFKFKARPWALTKVPSVCTYCPSQCQIDFSVNHMDNGVYRVTSDDQGTSNNGNLCVGGFFGHDYINSSKRLQQPKVNHVETSWEKALDKVAGEIERIREESGATAIAGLASARLSNEENYLFQKLFRAAIGSNNIDSEARYGATRALQGLQAVGLTGANNSLEAIEQADAVLIFGADPTAEAAAVDWKIQNAVRRGDGQLVIANMKHIHLAQFANCELTYKPGSEIALAKGLARLLVDRELIDQAELERCVTVLDDLKQDLAAVDMDQVVAATGLGREALEQAADIIGQAKQPVIIFGGDISRSNNGTDKVAAIANLAIMAGALSNGGLYPLDERGNSRGLLDMGVCPETLPGYQDYASARQRFASAWKCELPESGLNADEILTAIEAGQIRFLYLAATNPQSFANSSRWLSALEKVEVLVVQDIFPTAITKLANVVLPGCSVAEKTGRFTALDGTVRLAQKAIKPIGQSLADGAIFAELYSRLSGTRTNFDSQAIQAEIEQLTDLYSGYTALGDSRQTSRPAYPAVASGSLCYQSVADNSATADSMQLLVGTSNGHFGTTSTWTTAPMEVEPEGLISINPADAAEAGISDGNKIRLTSSVSSLRATVKLTDKVPRGLLFAASNFVEPGVQQLLADGDNRIAVQIEKA